MQIVIIQQDESLLDKFYQIVIKSLSNKIAITLFRVIAILLFYKVCYNSRNYLFIIAYTSGCQCFEEIIYERGFEMNVTKEKMKIIIAMLIWGTIGIFVREISLNSMEIAFLRAFIGSLSLFIFGVIMGEKLDISLLKKNLPILILSGATIGANWIFLFQGYKYTTISNATLSYYFAPVFIVILSSLVLKEKLSVKKMVYVVAALIGLFLILQSGESTDISSYDHGKGILYGLGGAVLYAVIIMLNKHVKGGTGLNTTLIQLFVAAMVLLPFILGQSQSILNIKSMEIRSWVFLILLGIIHTGVAYLLYFSSISTVDGQSIAILSYIDPIFAVLISSLFLGENLGILQILGGILILGSTYLSEK